MKKATKKKSSNLGKKRVSFQVEADPASDVFISGSFNNWNPCERNKRLKEGPDGVFSIRLLLPKGRHEYKFVINGEWYVDSTCPDWAPNEIGSLNSVLDVE